MAFLGNLLGIQNVALHPEQLQTLTATQSFSSQAILLTLMASTAILARGLFIIDTSLRDLITQQERQFNQILPLLNAFNISLNEIEDIDINISGDDLNITIDLSEIGATLDAFYSAYQVYEDKEQQILSSILQSSEFVQNTVYTAGRETVAALNRTADQAHQDAATGDSLLDDIFNSADGWGTSIKDHFEDAEDILGTIADAIDIVHDVIEAVSVVIQGIQQTTLSGILAALQAGAFDAKVMAAIAEARFEVRSPDLTVGEMTMTSAETVEILFDACEYDPFGFGPINCDGMETIEFNAQGLISESIRLDAVQIIPIIP